MMKYWVQEIRQCCLQLLEERPEANVEQHGLEVCRQRSSSLAWRGVVLDVRLALKVAVVVVQAGVVPVELLEVVLDARLAGWVGWTLANCSRGLADLE